MNYGINKEIENLRIIEIAPIQILGKLVYCIGFEEIESYRHDNFHIALIFSNTQTYSEENILDTVQNIFNGGASVPVRIHSECLLGDVFFSDLCDCGEQLKFSLETIFSSSKGILVYLRQEGRGLGLRAKLSCLSLQEGFLNGKKIAKKYTPDEANLAIGRKIDERSYEISINLLRFLGISSVQLITGNPDKVYSIQKAGISISKIIEMPKTFFKSEREKIELHEKLRRSYFYPNTKNLIGEI